MYHLIEDKRHDLLELKKFLERAINEVDDQLIFTDPSVSKGDYDFLITKAKKYRENLQQITVIFETSNK